MTMGPLPMSRIDSMSVRLGIAGDEVGELCEEIAGVVGAGTGLGVVLHAEGGNVAAAQSFDDPVVEVDVGDVGAVDRTFDDGVVVVLAGDLDSPGCDPADRMIPPVVAELQLVGLAAEGRA